MAFTYHRTVRFADTDAAGVVYFANVLSICHEAYEASLAAASIDLKRFFRGTDGAIPIVHATVDFFRPMTCGDRLAVRLTPQPLNDSEFEITYEIFLEPQWDRSISKARTRHVSINPATRSRQPVSPTMQQWWQQWALEPAAPDASPAGD